MASHPVTQRSFAGGEITPNLHGRTDLDKYGTALKTCRNMVVTATGALRRRPGTEYIDRLLAEEDVNGRAGHVFPFIFSSAQAYALVFEDRAGAHGFYWISVYHDGALIPRAAGDPEWVSGPGGYAKNDHVAHEGKLWRAIDTVPANKHPDLEADYWVECPYCGFESPWNPWQIGEVKHSQCGDVLTLTHSSGAVYEVTRSAHDVWAIAAADLPVQDGYTPTDPAVVAPEAPPGYPVRTWYYRIAAVVAQGRGAFRESKDYATCTAANTGLDPSTVPASVSWTAPAGLPAGSFYRVYRGLDEDGALGLCGETSGTTFKDSGNAPDLGRVSRGVLGSDATLLAASGNYPACVAHYEQRRVFAGWTNDPIAIAASDLASFSSFTEPEFGPPQSDDGMLIRLAAYRMERAVAMVAFGRLLVFSSEGEWDVGPIDASGFGPQTASAKQMSRMGCSPLCAPLVVGDSVVWVGAQGNAVYQVSNADGGGWAVRDLTVMAGHLLDGHTIVDWDFQRDPDPIIWAVRDDGVLLGLTLSREHELVAWHQHETQGTFENVCCIPENGATTVYLLVRRTLLQTATPQADTEYLCLERMTWAWPSDLRDANHLDCSTALYDGRQDYDSRTAYQPKMVPKTGRTWSNFGGEVRLEATGIGTLINGATFYVRLHPGMRDGSSGGVTASRSLEVFVTDSNVPGEPDVVLGLISPAQLTAGLDVPYRCPETGPALRCPHWDVATVSASGTARFGREGSATAPDALADGAWLSDSDSVSGTLALDNPAAVISAGFPFDAEVELLEALPPRAEIGNRQTAIRKMSIFGDVMGRPAMGTSLDSLTPEVAPTPPVDSAGPYALNRSTVAGQVFRKPQDESWGAIKQTGPYPLRILRVRREADFGEE